MGSCGFFSEPWSLRTFLYGSAQWEDYVILPLLLSPLCGSLAHISVCDPASGEQFARGLWPMEKVMKETNHQVLINIILLMLTKEEEHMSIIMMICNLVLKIRSKPYKTARSIKFTMGCSAVGIGSIFWSGVCGEQCWKFITEIIFAILGKC